MFNPDAILAASNGKSYTAPTPAPSVPTYTEDDELLGAKAAEYAITGKEDDLESELIKIAMRQKGEEIPPTVQRKEIGKLASSTFDPDKILSAASAKPSAVSVPEVKIEQPKMEIPFQDQITIPDVPIETPQVKPKTSQKPLESKWGPFDTSAAIDFESKAQALNSDTQFQLKFRDTLNALGAVSVDTLVSIIENYFDRISLFTGEPTVKQVAKAIKEGQPVNRPERNTPIGKIYEFLTQPIRGKYGYSPSQEEAAKKTAYLRDYAQSLRDQIAYPDSLNVEIANIVQGAGAGAIEFWLGPMYAGVKAWSELKEAGIGGAGQAVGFAKGFLWRKALGPAFALFHSTLPATKAIGSGLMMWADGIVRPYVDEYIEKAFIDPKFIDRFGVQVNDLDAWNRRVFEREQLKKLTWDNSLKDLGVGILISMSKTKPPSKYESLFKKYGDPSSPDYIDFNKLAKNVVKDENNSLVVMDRVDNTPKGVPPIPQRAEGKLDVRSPTQASRNITELIERSFLKEMFPNKLGRKPLYGGAWWEKLSLDDLYQAAKEKIGSKREQLLSSSAISLASDRNKILLDSTHGVTKDDKESTAFFDRDKFLNILGKIYGRHRINTTVPLGKVLKLHADEINEEIKKGQLEIPFPSEAERQPKFINKEQRGYPGNILSIENKPKDFKNIFDSGSIESIEEIISQFSNGRDFAKAIGDTPGKQSAWWKERGYKSAIDFFNSERKRVATKKEIDTEGFITEEEGEPNKVEPQFVGYSHMNSTYWRSGQRGATMIFSDIASFLQKFNIERGKKEDLENLYVSPKYLGEGLSRFEGPRIGDFKVPTQPEDKEDMNIRVQPKPRTEEEQARVDLEDALRKKESRELGSKAPPYEYKGRAGDEYPTSQTPTVIMPEYIARSFFSDKRKQEMILSVPSSPAVVGKGMTEEMSNQFAGKKLLVSVGTSPKIEGHEPWSVPIKVDYVGRFGGFHAINYRGERFLIHDEYFRVVNAIKSKPIAHEAPSRTEFTQDEVTNNPNTLYVTNDLRVMGNNVRRIRGDAANIERTIALLREEISFMRGAKPTFEMNMDRARIGELISGRRVSGFSTEANAGEIGNIVKLYAPRTQEEFTAGNTPSEEFVIVGKEKIRYGNYAQAAKAAKVSIADLFRDYEEGWEAGGYVLDKGNILKAKKVLGYEHGDISKFVGQYLYEVEYINRRFKDIKISLPSFESDKESNLLNIRLQELAHYSENVNKPLESPEYPSFIVDVKDGSRHDILPNIKFQIAGTLHSGETVFHTADGRMYTREGVQIYDSTVGPTKLIQFQREYSEEGGISDRTSGVTSLQLDKKVKQSRVPSLVEVAKEDPSWTPSKYKELQSKDISYFDMIVQGIKRGQIISLDDAAHMKVGDILRINYTSRKKFASGKSHDIESGIVGVKILSMKEVLRSDLGNAKVEYNKLDPYNKLVLESLSAIEGVDVHKLREYYLDSYKYGYKPDPRYTASNLIWKGQKAMFIRYELVQPGEQYMQPSGLASGVAMSPKMVWKTWKRSYYKKLVEEADITSSMARSRAFNDYWKDMAYGEWGGDRYKSESEVQRKTVENWADRFDKYFFDAFTEAIGNPLVVKELFAEPKDVEPIVRSILSNKYYFDKYSKLDKWLHPDEINDPTERMASLLYEGINHGYSPIDMFRNAVREVMNKTKQPEFQTLSGYLRGVFDIEVSFAKEQEQVRLKPTADIPVGVQEEQGVGISRETPRYEKLRTELPFEAALPKSESEAKVMEEILRECTIIDMPMEHGVFEVSFFGERFIQERANHMRAVEKAFKEGRIDPTSDIAIMHYITYPEIYWKYGGKYRTYLQELSKRANIKEEVAFTKELKSMKENQLIYDTEKTVEKWNEARKAKMNTSEEFIPKEELLEAMKVTKGQAEERIGGQESDKLYDKQVLADDAARALQKLARKVTEYAIQTRAPQAEQGKLFTKAKGQGGMLDFTGLFELFKRHGKEDIEGFKQTRIAMSDERILHILRNDYQIYLTKAERVKALEIFEFLKLTTVKLHKAALATNTNPYELASQIFMQHFPRDIAQSMSEIYVEQGYLDFFNKDVMRGMVAEAADDIYNIRRIDEKGKVIKGREKVSPQDKKDFWERVKKNEKSLEQGFFGTMAKTYKALSFYKDLPPYARMEMRNLIVDIDEIHLFARDLYKLTSALSDTELRYVCNNLQWRSEKSRNLVRRGGYDPEEAGRLDQLLMENDAKINLLPPNNKVMLKRVEVLFDQLLNKSQTWLRDEGSLAPEEVLQFYAPLKVFPYLPKYTATGSFATPLSIKNPAQIYTFATKGLKLGQEYETLTAKNLVDHLSSVMYDIAVKKMVKKICTAYDMNRFVSEEFRYKNYGQDANFQAREWGEPRAELYSGADILRYGRWMGTAGEAGENPIKDGRYYKVWSPDFNFEERSWTTEHAKETGFPEITGYKQTYLLDSKIVEVFERLAPPSNAFVRAVNTGIGLWKRAAIYSVYPKYMFGNFVGDTVLFTYMHPEMRKVAPYIMQAEKLLRKHIVKEYPHRFMMKDPEKFKMSEFEAEAWEIAKKAGILEAGMFNDTIATMPKGKVVSWATFPFRVMGDIAQGREAWFRLANTMYMLAEYKAGRGDQLYGKFKFLPRMEQTLGVEGVPDPMKVLYHSAREFSIDYARKSPQYRRFISGMLFPFAPFYVDAPVLAARWFAKGFQGKTTTQKMSHFGRAIGGLMFMPAMAEFANMAVELFMSEDEKEERRKVEASLHPSIRARTHFIAYKKDSGEWVVWTPPNPFDIMLGTKWASGITNFINRVRTGEQNWKDAATECLKDWATQEVKGAAYLTGPWFRFFSGLVMHKDPFDGVPIASSTDWSKLPWPELAWNIMTFQAKCMVPFMSSFIVNVEGRTRAPSSAITDFMKQWASPLEAMGVKDYVPPSEGFKQSESGGMIYTQRKVQMELQEARHAYDKISNNLTKDWVRSGMTVAEYKNSDEFQEYMEQYRDMYNKYAGEDKGDILFNQNIDHIVQLFEKRAEDPDWEYRWYENKVRDASGDEKEELIRALTQVKYQRGVEAEKKLPRPIKSLIEAISDPLVGRGD